MAASGTVQELERALDEYQYALTIEWDQKDSTFMTEKTEAFYKTLAALMDKGLTQTEIMDLVAKKSSHPKELEALTLKMKMLAETSSSSAELAQVITENSKNFYATGASWEGYYYATAGIFVVVAALVGYSIWFESQRTCVATAQGTQCGWVAQYIDGPQFYQCWETTYCTEYVQNN
jgi:hypothetical protein